jgi:D-alanyl-lipoteichoic acid acyltransferase DltB (MBOAT superfamily)
VYAHPAAFSGSAITTATVFFAFQLYCDFSGYTDTARGVARLLGFELILNFDRPYFSRTPVEFWRRWHISLSQWFQDYLYFPMAMHYMRKGGWGSKYKAHIIAMTLIGFWHGANWTFIVFGLYWGCVIAFYLYRVERAAATATPAAGGRRLFASDGWLAQAFSTLAMFVIVCIGWVFFRATSIGDAFYILTHVFSSSGVTAVVGWDIPPARVLWPMVIGLLLVEWLSGQRAAWISRLQAKYGYMLILRHAMLAAILFSYLVVQQGRSQAFIYFQF